jgi:hypothetical protein
MSGTGGFQTQVYSQPSPAVAGDRASQNPIASYDAGPGGLVSGAALFVGRFAWVNPPLDPNGTPAVANCSGAGAPAGFVMREMQGTNTTFLSYAGMQILPGQQCALQTTGDFWVVNDGSSQANYGMKAYADLATGKVSFAATGSPTTGPSATGSSIAASTFSVTGSIAGDVLTVTAVGSGTVVAGATISGTGVASGTKVLSQISGTAGGVGTYRVSIANQTVASTTVSGAYGTFTVGTLTTTPTFAVGQQLNATGSVVAGTTITQLLTGNGGSGSTFAVDNNTVVGSQTISALTSVETKFYARSVGGPGELVKISSWTNAGGQ